MPYPDNFSLTAYEAHFGGMEEPWEQEASATLYTSAELEIRKFNAELTRLAERARALRFYGECPLEAHDADSIADHLLDVLIPESDIAIDRKAV